MMKSLQYHWSFIFLWVLALSWVVQFPNIASVAFIGILLWRLYCLHQSNIWGIILICSLLLGSRFWFIHQERIQVTHIDFSSREAVYMLEVDPLSIGESEVMWIGQGKLQLGTGVVQVEWHLSKEKMIELPTMIERWYIKGNFMHPEPARNFFVFDYARYLATQAIYWQLDIQSIQQQEIISDRLDNVRIAMMQPFLAQRSIDWVALHNKLLWNLDSQVYRTYRSEFVALGIAHFFAISGFHVHYIRQLLDYILRRSGITVETSRWILFFLLLMYSWLVRFPIGVVRVLTTLYSTKIFRRYQLPFSSLDALALTGIGLLLWQPQLGVAIGFLLSFLITYLIHFYSQTMPANKSRWRIRIELTVTCLLFSWPLIMQQSHEWNGWQLLYVLVFSLAFEHLLFPWFVATSLSLWWLPSHFFVQISSLFEVVWQAVMKLTSSTRPIIIGHLPWWQLVGLLAVAGYWLHAVHHKPKRAVQIVFIAYGLLLWVVPYLNPVESITVIDVGQGDALLYRPAFSQEAWLFDTGGRPDLSKKTVTPDANYAKRTIIPALKALGVRRLTGVVITHPDLDHIGNLAQLAQAIPMDTLVITPYTQQSVIWQQIAPELPKQTHITILPFTSQLQHSSLPIQLLTGPDLSEVSEMDGANDTSIVARMTLGPMTLMNMGDLSSNAERVFMQYYPNLIADILKTGHHGSKHSTSQPFLEQLQPKLALISAGYQNRYGHPHDETLARLHKEGIPYLATNEHGAIQLTYDGLRGVQMITVLPNDSEN